MRYSRESPCTLLQGGADAAAAAMAAASRAAAEAAEAAEAAAKAAAAATVVPAAKVEMEFSSSSVSSTQKQVTHTKKT